ncbi:MAG: HesA/MoeB/ThiF family protein [Bacteroidia bacterium]|nr:HesA/MoeB/ThiF family protein [Bacteroidia bacterium]
MDSKPKYQRYLRQLLLNEFGPAAQEKLLKSSVLVIGAGGLGCPALQYLAAAGVGRIGIADGDVVELSNLQRQILYNESDIGKNKATCAAEKITALNSSIEVEVFAFHLTNQNITKVMIDFDLVIDGSDNFATRYLVNDCCVVHGLPLVYGAVLRFEGQVGVFNVPDKKTKTVTDYRDLFPEPPQPNALASCNEVGVLGVIPGIIGVMQATEAIKIITGIGQPLTNKIITYNALHNSFYDTEITPSLKKLTFLSSDEIESFDYAFFCSAHYKVSELSPEEFETLRTKENVVVIDIREKHELPKVNQFQHLNITIAELYNAFPKEILQKEIVLFCNTGARSTAMARNLKQRHPELNLHSLAGGIWAWKKQFKLFDE